MTSQVKPKPVFPNWAELIWQLRLDLGETQREFGKRFKVSQVAVSDWERGVSDPPGNVTWWVHGRLNGGKR